MLKRIGNIIVFVVVAIVMYHMTYYFFWLTQMNDIVYATITLVVIFTSLYYKRRLSRHIRFIIYGAWILGAVYALLPTMIIRRSLSEAPQYYEGLIARWSNPIEVLTSFFHAKLKFVLVDKWGRKKIDTEAVDFYYHDEHIIIAENYEHDRENNEWVFEIKVYRDVL